MYKQYEIIAEIVEAISEVLRACDFANIPCSARQQILTSEDSTILKVYLNINGLDYLIKFTKELTYTHYSIDNVRLSREDLMNHLSKLVQMVEEYEEAVA